MNAKHFLLRCGQAVLLAGLFFACFTAGHLLFPVDVRFQNAPAAAGSSLPGLTALVLVDTLLVMAVLLRSRWRGWRLALAVAISLYGVMTFMGQIETAWFAAALNIPTSQLPALFLMTSLGAFVFVPLAVLVLGKWQGQGEGNNPAATLPGTIGGWAWRLATIAVLYFVLYFSFGYIVAWQNPALREMYGNGSNADAFNIYALVPFQLLRGVLWALFALPIILLDRGGRWQTAVLVGLWLALPLNMFHAVPNAFMPDPAVRLSHFIETVSSNFLFGVALTWLLTWRPAQARKQAAQAGSTLESKPV